MYRIVVAISVLQLLCALFFVYPTLRLGTWLGITPAMVWGIATLLFFSQLIARGLLRNPKSRWKRGIRRGADFVLGLAPVLLGVALLGEITLAAGLMAPQTYGAVALVVLGVTGLWSVWKAYTPDLVTIELTSAKLRQPVVFAQISDVHIGSRSQAFLARVIALVNSTPAEFLCITGDLVDETGISSTRLEPLGQFTKARYFCSGNHEHYEDWPQIKSDLERLGVQVLQGSTIEHEQLQIIGFDDHAHPDFLGEALPQLNLRQDLFSVLLFHRPLGLNHAAAHGIDLQLAGHTHNGQIKPFNLLVRLQFKFLKGLYKEGDTHLYVNEGTGTWGPPMRLGSRSEVTLFRISPS